MLILKPIFKCSCLEHPVGVCATKPRSFSSTCKNLRLQHPRYGLNMVFQKGDFSESKLTHPTWLLVDQSLPDGRTMNRVYQSITCLSDFGNVYPFRRYSRSTFKVALIMHIFGHKFFLGKVPQIF